MEPTRGTAANLLYVLLKHRKFLFWNTFIVTALVLGMTFILTPRYTAITTLLPPQGEDKGLLGLGNLLQQFDIGRLSLTGATSSAQVYVAILKSRTIQDSLVTEFGLMERYEVKTPYSARRVLVGRTNIKLSSTGVIEVAVADEDPAMAADLANAYIENLDKMNRELRSTEGKRTRVFVEERLSATAARLRAAEDSLLAYQQRHPGIALPAEVMSAASASADLMARRIALGYELELRRSTLQPGAAPLLRKEAEVRALDRELENLPALTVEMGRRYRNFKVQEQVFELLSAQYETARIKEAKDVATVDVLDLAVPPDRRSYPRRGLSTGAAFLLSTLIGVFLVVSLEYSRRNLLERDSILRQLVKPGGRLDRLFFGRS